MELSPDPQRVMFASRTRDSVGNTNGTWDSYSVKLFVVTPSAWQKYALESKTVSSSLGMRIAKMYWLTNLQFKHIRDVSMVY